MHRKNYNAQWKAAKKAGITWKQNVFDAGAHYRASQ